MKEFYRLLEDDELQPGEKRPASEYIEKLRKYERLEAKIADHRNFLNSIETTRGNTTTISNELRKEFEDLESSVRERIASLRAAINMAKEREFSDKRMTDFFNKLETECSEYITIIKNTRNFLYRGVNDDRNAFYAKTRIDRNLSKFKDDEVYQQVLNSLLTRNGFEVTKSNSIACTTSLMSARNYGYNQYIIFPKNGFKFTWFGSGNNHLTESSLTGILDPVKIGEFLNELRDVLKKVYTIDINSDEYRKLPYNVQRLILIAFQEPTRYFSISEIGVDALNLLNRHRSIYTEIPEKFFLTPEQKLDMVSDEKFVNEFRPNNNSLESALDMRSAMILVSGEYYAMISNQFRDRIVSRFFNDKGPSL